MSEVNFQQQLQVLKQQVSEMSARYRPDHTFDDPFPHQLRDLEAKMASMRDKLTKYDVSTRPVSPPATRFVDTQPSPMQRALNARGTDMSTQNQFTLPSGPLFWQLYDTLRTDMQSLEGRVSDLEQNVLSLEDRIDSLEPVKFTPAASTVSSDSLPQYCGLDINSDPPCAAASELDSNVDTRGNILQQSWGQSQNVAQFLKPIRQLLPLNGQSPRPEWAHLQNFGYNEENIEFDLLSEIASSNSNIGVLKAQNVQLQDSIVRLNRDNEKILEAINDLTSNLRFRAPHDLRRESECYSQNVTTAKPEGVAFRDREIDRMDDQLRAVQEQLRASEDNVAQKEDMIAHMQAMQEAHAMSSQEWMDRDCEHREQVALYHKQLYTKDDELQALQELLAKRDRSLEKMEERCSYSNEYYRRAAADAKAYEEALRDERGRRHVENEQRSASHDAKIKRLQDFCEQKDAVIYEQEQMMSRGGKLMKEKDKEIDHVQRQLHAALDHRDSSLRTEDRLARLLEEKDAELERLTAALEATTSEAHRSEAIYEGVEDSEQRPPWRRSDSELATDRDVRIQTKDDRAESSEANFGHPTSMRSMQHSHQRERRDRRDDRPRRHRDRHTPRILEWHASRPQDPTRDDAVSTNVKPSKPGYPDRTFRPPHDDTLRPPLPAPTVPTTARRMASESNLQSRSPYERTPARQVLAKHQSMQDLSFGRRNLQPYVETDAESG